ncbi:MAG: hypothetical protein AAFY03_02430, partial [Pseudomonadota bacterium]
DRAELFATIEEWCSNPSVSMTEGQALTLEGGAGTAGVLRGFGLRIEGDVSGEIVESLNTQLNGIRRSADDCRFEAFALLSKVFTSNSGPTTEPVASPSIASPTNAIEQAADKCQRSGALEVCINTARVRRFGNNLRIPFTLKVGEGQGANVTVAFEGGGGSIFTDSGATIEQTLQAKPFTIYSGQRVTQAFAATLEGPPFPGEVAVEIAVSSPIATQFFFDRIFVR